MKEIFKNIYKFSTYIPPINLSFNQYLVDSDQPLLIHTGSIQQAEGIVKQIKEIIKDKPLAYIFISHFESDECGGLTTILKHYPEAKVIASEISVRQLQGFGLVDDILIQKANEVMKIGNNDYKFIAYPSEMHLWPGLLLLDTTNNILYSSDLFISFGDNANQMAEISIKEALDMITTLQIPDENLLNKLKSELNNEDIRFIATGHGKSYQIRKVD